MKLKEYASLLLKWNKIHNLSGAQDLQTIEEIIQDCLDPLAFIDPFKSVVDIGSGCGFPAIPLAIKNPQSLFFLTEPRKKRASFLQTICIELELSNVAVFHSTIQEAKIPQKVDLITSKAVGNVSFLIKISSHLLSTSGAFLFYKGSKFLEEKTDAKESEIFTSPSGKIYFYRRNGC